MNKSKYKLNKHCKICGNIITDKNKTGYCCKCYLKYGLFGENNPFYGRKHSIETIENTKKKLSEISKELWKDENYRNKIINHTTGKTRSEDFKKKQSINAKEQFKDINQRKIRSERMKISWQNGKITNNGCYHANVSKEENEFFDLLSKSNIFVERRKVIKYINEKTNRNRHLFPDGFIEKKKIVIEFNDSFWHADKKLFPNDNTKVHHNKTAKEIRDHNNEKKKLYKKLGYNLIVVWSLDYEKDKEKCVKKVINIINKIN